MTIPVIFGSSLGTSRVQGQAGNGGLEHFALYLRTEWLHAHSARKKGRLADELYGAAIDADRPDLAEEAVAGGPLASRQIPVHCPSRRVPLHVVRAFEEITVDPDDEQAYAPNQGRHWLARRITADALEVWSPTHGWLFDGAGRLLNEASSPCTDAEPMGRQWHGAFLPDGRWVTTEVSGYDCALSFFSREGKFLKTVPSAELAPPGPYDARKSLLGWARSDKTGKAWIVSVGSEEGYATVQVGPEGPARVLLGTERWLACHPRARGEYIVSWVPDDSGRVLLKRDAAGHGPGVGYPSYSLVRPAPLPVQDVLAGGKGFCGVPDGNFLFGFWPGRRSVFIGARRSHDGGNATWFFSAHGSCRGWLHARRVADAADGRAMLFRLDDTKAVATLDADLRTTAMRRFEWPDGSTAVALSLYDDLRMGLFASDGKLILAGWK